VAIALAAGVQASNALLHNAQRQDDALLAQICAENELIQIRLSRQLPGIGDSDFVCEQAGRVFGGTLSVAATPNPDFRRVEARVRKGPGQAEYPVLSIATVVGRF
jgi:general secretion pathway protein I